MIFNYPHKAAFKLKCGHKLNFIKGADGVRPVSVTLSSQELRQLRRDLSYAHALSSTLDPRPQPEIEGEE